MALLSLYKKVGNSLNAKNLKDLIFNPEKCIFVFILLFFIEIFVNCCVINNIKYTEIDWKAYMQEVEGFTNGTTDYAHLRGDTGPLVYPAGFVYIFTALYYLTNRGVNVRLAQYWFAGLYQITLITIFFIYSRVKKVPPYAFFFMCCASYRVHSIYVLRLFNDPVAMTIFYAAVCFMLIGRWSSACVFYSIAVSVKMNLLLFSPALLLLLLATFTLSRTLAHLVLCALVQLILGAPFLLTNPLSYIQRSFEFSRQFIFKWTVNWRFVGEDFFLDRRFHTLLLLCHLCVLSAFLYLYWIRQFGGVIDFVKAIISSDKDFITINHQDLNSTTPTTPTQDATSQADQIHTTATTTTTLPTTTTLLTTTPPLTTPLTTSNTAPQTTSTTPQKPRLSSDTIVTMLFVCNIVGMSFSRSLHYQFYVWYFHTLPHILWSTKLSSPVRLVLLGLIEMCWNCYPSTNLSSITLHLCHLTILVAIFYAICFPWDEKDAKKDDDKNQYTKIKDKHLKREVLKENNSKRKVIGKTKKGV